MQRDGMRAMHKGPRHMRRTTWNSLGRLHVSLVVLHPFTRSIPLRKTMHATVNSLGKNVPTLSPTGAKRGAINAEKKAFKRSPLADCGVATNTFRFSR